VRSVAALDLYRFRYIDRLSGKWLTARHVATKEEIAARYKDFELLGEPEVREPRSTEPFNPFRGDRQ
jgi:hypothetical protein